MSVDLEIAKSNIVFRTFVHTADQSYCVARWARQNRFYIDFSWSSVHAIEKYLKAILLLNGEAVSSCSHDIVKLWHKTKSLCGVLLPDSLTPHPEIPRHVDIESMPTIDFLSFLDEFGSSDARYGTAGHYVRMGDLLHLDALVFAVRRIICPLDRQLNDSPTAMSFRDWLGKNPDQLLSRRGFLWEKISELHEPEIGSVANCNLAFALDQTKHDWSWISSSWREAPLDRDVFHALQSSDRGWAEQGVALSEWILGNMKVGKEFRAQVTRLIAEAKTRHQI
jgi:hypothetical protein